MSNYNTTLQSNNTDLQAILDSINELPEANGSNSNNRFPNGTEWTQSNITSGNFNKFYNANGIWVASGINIGLYYSVDGKTWIQSNITSGTFNGFYNANGIWVAGSSNGIYYSVAWEPSTQ